MLYEPIRKLLCPFDQIAALIPSSGKILDVGCGHGTLAEILARNHPKRQILGIDPSLTKITIAKKKEREFNNVKFKKAYLEEITESQFDCIVVMDVLYLFSDQEKLSFLKKAHQRLKKNGLLIVKTDSREPRVLFNLLKLEETLMVKAFKYTFSEKQKIYFTSRETYRKVIRQAGFKIIAEKTFTSTFPYRHPTYVAQKN